MIKKILCVSHHDEVDLGTMKEFFKKRNFQIVVIKPLNNEDLFEDISSFYGIIILGGAMNVSDTEEFPGLLKEIKWIKNIIKSDIPVLGICLGAQLIAKASDAKVGYHKDNMIEVGYKEIFIDDTCKSINNLPKMVYQLHKQGFSLPEGAEKIAYNSLFDVQAFSMKKNIFAFQFHPEIIENMILRWNSKSIEMLKKKGLQNINIQLLEHKKYSSNVKYWFETFLKNWI